MSTAYLSGDRAGVRAAMRLDQQPQNRCDRSMKRIGLLLAALAACDPDSDYLGKGKDLVAGGPTSACCAARNDKGCAASAQTLCACVEDAGITATNVGPFPGHATERVRVVTMTVEGPHGKGTCNYTYGYGILNATDCKCESTK